MADVKWIKITTDIFDNEKILLIESLPEPYAIITVWFKLLCLAGKQNNSGVFMLGRLPYTEKMLATIFRMNEATVTMALNTFEQFGMVEIVDGVITIPNWEKHQSLDKFEMAKEQTRIRVAKHREKQKLLTGVTQSNVTGNVTVTQCNADRIEEDKDIDIDKEDNNIVHLDESEQKGKKPSLADVNSFFNALWDMYPVKKGKGQVSEAKRRLLYSIGFDQLQKSIERYLDELKKDADWRRPQNGSTFFNSGYVDYLDENFVPDKKSGGRKEKLPGWMTERRGLDEDEAFAISQMMSEEDLKEAEQLRRELQALSN